MKFNVQSMANPFVVFASLSLAVAACGASDLGEEDTVAATEDELSVLRISESDNNGTVSVPLGTTFKIVLRSSPSTGQRWAIVSAPMAFGAPRISSSWGKQNFAFHTNSASLKAGDQHRLRFNFGSDPNGFPQKTFSVTIALTPGASAKCEKLPNAIDIACPTQYEPVCGCDGKTYSNACTANANGISSFTVGACAGQCTKFANAIDIACPTQYDPACGCDGKTYSNSCEAKKSVSSFTAGVCPK